MPQPRVNPKNVPRGTRIGRTVRVQKQKAQKKALTAEQLYEQAQTALAFENYEAALECFKDALQLEPENVEVLDAYGALLAEVGQREEAIKVLQKVVTLSPEEGFEKYMYLGQLLESPEEAITATTRGVELLQKKYEEAQQAAGPSSSSIGSGAAAAAGPLKAQLCSALCSLAEMRMALADDMSEVAGAVEGLLNRAKAVHPQSPEPLQALASLKYEQGQSEEALALLKQGLALWFKPKDDDSEESEEDEDEELEDAAAEELDFRIPKKPTTLSEDMDTDRAAAADMEEDEDEDEDEEEGPSYEFRFEAAKLLLELDETTDTAVQVLEDLVCENDTVPDVWHLLGLAFYSGGHLDEAEEVGKRGVQLLQKQGAGPEDELLASFLDLESAISEARAAGDAGT